MVCLAYLGMGGAVQWMWGVFVGYGNRIYSAEDVVLCQRQWGLDGGFGVNEFGTWSLEADGMFEVRVFRMLVALDGPGVLLGAFIIKRRTLTVGN